jgi:hypothetical protein
MALVDIGLRAYARPAHEDSAEREKQAGDRDRNETCLGA